MMGDDRDMIGHGRDITDQNGDMTTHNGDMIFIKETIWALAETWRVRIERRWDPTKT